MPATRDYISEKGPDAEADPGRRCNVVVTDAACWANVIPAWGRVDRRTDKWIGSGFGGIAAEAKALPCIGCKMQYPDVQ